MQAQEVLSYLEAEGLHIDPIPGQSDRVRVTPVKGELTDEHRRLIREHKPALVALLTRRPIPVPPLSPPDREAIREAIAERAAIREHDGGEPRPLAEHRAHASMRVYRVLVAMDHDQPPRWATLLAPGCDLAEATHAAQGRFGTARVLELHERPFPPPGAKPLAA
ncbi:MAG: hypothetical protein KAX64_03720 [Chromatiaceae bacterium]|nr:hypothetical protein [Chromatiaceae bacterium]MBP8282948.1 hypothetical protein [Chromatiaceae bacterium]